MRRAISATFRRPPKSIARFRSTCSISLALGRIRRSGLFGCVSSADRKAAQEALSAVGLEGFERRQIGALSGGQTQRMMFARLMAQDARVILLDEPFSAVDERTLGDLLALMARWHSEGRTIVAVLHDFSPSCANISARAADGARMRRLGQTSEALSAGKSRPRAR